MLFSGLNKQGKKGIDAGAFTSFNTGGIDWEGNYFKKESGLKKAKYRLSGLEFRCLKILMRVCTKAPSQ